jgi:hypothetical protein
MVSKPVSSDVEGRRLQLQCSPGVYGPQQCRAWLASTSTRARYKANLGDSGFMIGSTDTPRDPTNRDAPRDLCVSTRCIESFMNEETLRASQQARWCLSRGVYSGCPVAGCKRVDRNLAAAVEQAWPGACWWWQLGVTHFADAPGHEPMCPRDFEASPDA